MKKTTLLFAGPSMYGLDLSRYSWLEVYGPACQSDIYSILNNKKVEKIILADGLYKSIPAPWHKEILLAMKMGIQVYGVSSLGALRAAELHEYGVKGSGKVYEYIKSNIVDDSEVAVMHKSETEKWEAMTVAHVEVMFWSIQMEREKKINKEQCKELQDWSKNTHFERRTKKALVREVLRYSQDYPELVNKTWFSQKQLDLVDLLKKMDEDKDYYENNTKNWKISKTPYIYKQISKDTSLLMASKKNRDLGDTLLNFLIYVLIEHKEIFQVMLLKTYLEYLAIELSRLRDSTYADEYNNYFMLYGKDDCFQQNKQFNQNNPTEEILKKEIRSIEGKSSNKIKEEMQKLNSGFNAMTREAKKIFEDFCNLIVKHGQMRSSNMDANEALSPNMRKELNASILKSLMQGEEIDLESRYYIYYTKQLIDSCSIYSHHGRLRIFNLLLEGDVLYNLQEKWMKKLESLSDGKPYAFYNEEVKSSGLDTAIKDMNQLIIKIQPLPVTNISESQELLFIEADSLAMVKYTLNNQ